MKYKKFSAYLKGTDFAREDDEHRAEAETQIGITLTTLGEVIK